MAGKKHPRAHRRCGQPLVKVERRAIIDSLLLEWQTDRGYDVIQEGEGYLYSHIYVCSACKQPLSAAEEQWLQKNWPL